jgi:hypothetical protein
MISASPLFSDRRASGTDVTPERCDFLSIIDQPIDRFHGKLTPLFGCEYLFVLAHSNIALEPLQEAAVSPGILVGISVT